MEVQEWEGRKILDIFQLFDANGDGIIDRDLMRTLFKRFGWDEAAIDKLLSAADVDGDGKLDYEEFVEWLVPKKASGIAAEAVATGAKSRKDTMVRYVRLEHSNQYLHVQQVEVYDARGNNCALASAGSSASQSSTLYSGDAGRPTDGNHDGGQPWPNSNHTLNGAGEWWEVDLGREIHCKQVVIYNRPDRAGDRLEGCVVKLLNGSRQDATPAAILKSRLNILSGERRQTIDLTPKAAAQRCCTQGCPLLVTGSCPNYCCAKCRNHKGRKGHGPACLQKRAPGEAQDVPSDLSAPEPEPQDGPLLVLESDEHVADLSKMFPNHREITEAAHRGISLDQLNRVLVYARARCNRWQDTSKYSKTHGQTLSMDMLNLYHLCTWLIMPSTKKLNCAFTELVASADQRPSWFVSHWWGEVHADFVKVVELHAAVRALPRNTYFWVCVYANRQHSLADEVVADPRQTSFYKAIRLCTGILLVLDDKQKFSGPATPFGRAWCAFEGSVALDQDDDLELVLDIGCCKDGVAHLLTTGLTDPEEKLNMSKYPGAGAKAKSLRERSFPLEVIESGLTLELEKAQASVESDRRRILNCIAGMPDLDGDAPEEHPAYRQLNRQSRAIFACAAWRQAVEKGMVERLNLAKVLADDETMRSLTMSFMLCPEMGGRQMALLGRGLPGNLKHLDIDFSKGEHVGDAGIAAFASGLPAGLETLKLLFRKCWQLGDRGLAALGAHLPAQLRVLDLAVPQCGGIGDSGLAALGQGLAKLGASVWRVDLDFGECLGLADRGLAALAGGLPRSLGSLSLCLSGCTSVTSLGFSALGLALPTQLEELSIGSTFTKADDACLAGLAPAVAANKSLRTLGLGFGASPQITDAGVAALTQTLPGGLESLSLAFDQCCRLGSPGVAAAMRSVAGLGVLRKITFHTNTSMVDDSGAAAFVQNLPSTVQEMFFQAGPGGWHSWGSTKLSPQARSAFTSLASLRAWKPSVGPAEPAQPATPLPKQRLLAALPPPLGTGESLAAALPLEPTEEGLAAEMAREDKVNYVRKLSPDEALIDVPTPCKNKESDAHDDLHIRFDVTGLRRMRRVLLSFSEIHNSHYICINELVLYSGAQKIGYDVLTKGGSAVKQSVGGWWAVAGEKHELVLDLGGERDITAVALLCANGNATPKHLRITEG